MKISKSLSENIRALQEIFPLKKSFDLVTRDLFLGTTRAYWLGINGLCDNELLQRIISDLQNKAFTSDEVIRDLPHYMAAKIGYVQAEQTGDLDTVVQNVLSGPSVLLVDGFDMAIILDTRSYPVRSIEEPDAERVTRGAKDGFVETIVYNTAMIRRRIRSPRLTFEICCVGRESRTDVAIAYLGGQADEKLISRLVEKISSLPVSALTMGSKSLEELLIPKRWFHPLPQLLFTERPDVASSYLLEGYVLVLVDNSPTAMVLPCNLFQFTQNPDDYYQNVSVGNYFRLMRFACILLSLYLMPLFLLLGSHGATLPAVLGVVISSESSPARLFLHVLLIELGLDLFNYSSSLAPGGYSHSLGLIGGLLIGQIAVDLKWLSIEALFYGAATLLASICIASKELSDALRLYRLFLILMVYFFDYAGLGIATALILLSAATTNTFGGKSYLWPLIPFDKKALVSMLVRYPAPAAQKGDKKGKNRISKR
ncbi:MAG: spore germination protein [Lachnospiraceae bacterium]|nr:spore germination protein [Lachnospiraceae bacterium]